MKNILVVFFTILFSISARAEYNGYHISFTIENVNGQESKGYVYVASAYLKMDSLQSTEYLKRALDQSDRDENWENRKALTYYKERIIYHYKPVNDRYGSQESYEYHLIGITKMSFNSIKKITIDEMIDWSYTTWLSILQKSSDLSWLKSKPMKSYFFTSFLCEYQVFVHEKNDAIDRLINKLVQIQTEINKIEATENYWEEVELRNKLDEAYEKMEEEVNKFIEQLFGFKIVIISFCTC